MKLFAILFIAACAVSIGAQAQTRKCVGTDGKVTYSDFMCANNTARETEVKTNANTLDASGMREDAKRMRTGEAVDQAMNEQSGQCRFSYFANGDSLGKTLAAAAKQECLSNIKARVTGEPTSQDAYTRWNDHSGRAGATRQAAITRSENAANAQRIANSNTDAARRIANSNQQSITDLGNQLNNKTYKCQPNLMGTGLDCK